MKYTDQLKTQKWRKFRANIIQRDKCCKLCSSERELQVHHRIYYESKKAWEYDESEVITLCSSCHEVFHEHRKPKFVGFNKPYRYWLVIPSNFTLTYSTKKLKELIKDQTGLKVTAPSKIAKEFIAHGIMYKVGKNYMFSDDPKKKLQIKITQDSIEIMDELIY